MWPFNRINDNAFPDYQVGDVLGFSGHSLSGLIINLGTWGVPWWGLSHVGIVGEHDGLRVVFESTTLCGLKCQVQGKKVSGVQAHCVGNRVKGYGGKVWKYRPANKLTDMQKDDLNAFLHSHIGVDYDAIGAFRSAGQGFSWLESKMRGEDLTSLFCSEYAAASLGHIGVLDIKNASRWSPNQLIRRCQKEGVLHAPERLR